MEMHNWTKVVNLMDDRTRDYELPPNKAVVAAFEQFEEGNYDAHDYPEPENHHCFREYLKGYSCGDWIARKEHTDSFAA